MKIKNRTLFKFDMSSIILLISACEYGQLGLKYINTVGSPFSSLDVLKMVLLSGSSMSKADNGVPSKPVLTAGRNDRLQASKHNETTKRICIRGEFASTHLIVAISVYFGFDLSVPPEWK